MSRAAEQGRHVGAAGHGHPGIDEPRDARRRVEHGVGQDQIPKSGREARGGEGTAGAERARRGAAEPRRRSASLLSGREGTRVVISMALPVPVRARWSSGDRSRRR